jgi:hypothetical protein
MRWSYRFLPIFAFLGLWGSFDTARADQVLVSTLLPDGVVSPNPLSPSQIDTSDFWAQEFTSGVSTNLVSIQASLGLLDPGANGGFSLTAQLIQVDNASDAPDMGSVVATLSQVGSISTTGFTNVEFDPSGTVGLSSSKFYWFVLSGAGDPTGSVQWQFSNSPNNLIGPGTLPSYALFDPGSWTVFPVNPANPSTYPFLIDVVGQGGTVPEPSSFALGCIGLTGALFARRWIKKSRSIA